MKTVLPSFVILLVAAISADAAIEFKGKRVKVYPTGFTAIAKHANMNLESCQSIAGLAYRMLAHNSDSITNNPTFPGDDLSGLAVFNPRTMCDGIPKVWMLGVGLHKNGDPRVIDHWFTLQTYGPHGDNAMIYQGFSYGPLGDGNAYTGHRWTNAVLPFLKDENIPDTAALLPPAVGHLPTQCVDLATYLDAWVNAKDKADIKAGYDFLFSPPNLLKADVKGEIKAFGKVWREATAAHIYVVASAPLHNGLKPNFLESAAKTTNDPLRLAKRLTKRQHVASRH